MVLLLSGGVWCHGRCLAPGYLCVGSWLLVCWLLVTCVLAPGYLCVGSWLLVCWLLVTCVLAPGYLCVGCLAQQRLCFPVEELNGQLHNKEQKMHAFLKHT
ncbi:hypothetical protein ATANTOWER_022110 [Ataeniobius toweri]|uniref:NADH dehydrogenase subunit 6 n=1 Tax=Ataeniobius toweri TaxID=208326 RepID=A0ABU7BRL4_9TELE|nr:hypothetical protein [Ataeniobius toweri]